MTPRLPPAPALDWIDGVPRARGDFYYSKAGGLAEAQAVFLAGCGLPAAWDGRRAFTIVELGFGTGLNALAAWRLWSATRAPGAILHYCSIEAAPMSATEAARALAAFPEIAPLADRLVAAWPVRARAPQRSWLDESFVLTLLIGEAEAALRGLAGQADAWFLDGFAPDRNPEMWSAELMGLVAARSAPGARLATYSVAGAVRRNLDAAGFAVAKRPGFAAKRERLEATFLPPPLRGRVSPRSGDGWGGVEDLAAHEVLPAPHPLPPPRKGEGLFPYSARDGRVAIIGGGIAGATLAHALARRGRDCVILDASAPWSPEALVMPQLDRGRGRHAEWRLAAFLAAEPLYRSLGVFETCGATEAVDAVAFADFAADPPLPPDWFDADGGRLLHRRAGVVRPAALIAALTRDVPRIAADVSRLERAGDRWRLVTSSGVVEADAVALCAGAQLMQFEETRWLPLRLSRGQLEWAPGTLPMACVDDAYAAPAGEGIVFGATYDRADAPDPPVPDEKSRRQNVAALARLAPRFELHGERMVSHTGLRAATPDFAPVVGLLPDVAAWKERYANLRHGRLGESSDSPAPPPSQAGVYVFGALSARGFTHAPLLAERLAAEMNAELPPMSRETMDALHPARFLLRALKRNE